MVKTDAKLNPKEFQEKEESEDGCLDINIFTKSMSKIEKIKGVTDSSPATWRFTFVIDGVEDILTISNRDLITGPMRFEDLFKSRFGFFLPCQLTKKPGKGKPNQWKKFQTLIEQIKIDVEPTESTEWLECDILLSQIASLPRTDDGEAWADKEKVNKTLFKKTLDGSSITYWCLKSNDVPMIVKDLKLSTSLADIVKTIITRKLRRKENATCRINPRLTVSSVWWFPEDVLISFGFRPMCVDHPTQDEEAY
jgi:hypothetical protein